MSGRISKGHRRVLEIIRDQKPEWDIGISNNKPVFIDGNTLYFDIFMERPFRVVIEVNGRQHEEYNDFFFDTPSKFEHYQANFEAKRKYAKDNGIYFIEINYCDINEDTLIDTILEKIYDQQQGG